MAVITKKWVEQRLGEEVSANDKARKLYEFLMADAEFNETYRMANKLTVERLGYNDHGIVHVKIVALNALKICRLLAKAGVKPTLVKENSGSQEDAEVVVMLGALLHDIGNAVHRNFHELNGVVLSNPLLKRALPLAYGEKQAEVMRLAVLECVFSSYERAPCISVESGIVSVADGTDCVNGRARIPYKVFGKNDIHAVSALAIKDLWLGKGKNTPVLIRIDMSNPAGLFQVQEVLMKKMNSSGIKEFVELDLRVNGKKLDTTDLSEL